MLPSTSVAVRFLTRNDLGLLETPDANVATTNANCRFGAKHQSLPDSFLVTGNVVPNNNRWDLVFDLPRSATESLRSGDYAWSVEVTDDHDAEITTIRGSMELTAKQTLARFRKDMSMLPSGKLRWV